jgi:predicted RNA-binding Zn-ribbon protein involved in translation (DUF1610 family)
MALCTSCGSEVDGSASFCTSCGQRMPAATQSAAAVTVTQPVCSACGAQVNPNSLFCTSCGQRIVAQPAAEVAPVPTVVEPAAIAAAVAPSFTATCTSCGSKLDPETRFCTACGQAVADSAATSAEPLTSVTPAPQRLHEVDSASTESTTAPIAAEAAVVSPAPVATTPEAPPTQPAVQEAPQTAPPLYATPSDYQPVQPGGGAFRMVVLILLLLIVAGAFGGWYFMGVETVIVCSPPDVTVFLDDKELAPMSYGRYVIPHLSRQAHLLKVRRAGFADTIQRLDFPLTSTHEWVNIKLVPSRQMRSTSPQ